MATFTAKVLGDGQLPSTKGTLYTVPGSTKAYLKQITLFNTNAVPQTVDLYLNVSGTSRRIARYVLAQNEWAEHDVNLMLEPGDLIEGHTTNATAVDYVITGIEES